MEYAPRAVPSAIDVRQSHIQRTLASRAPARGSATFDRYLSAAAARQPQASSPGTARRASPSRSSLGTGITPRASAPPQRTAVTESPAIWPTASQAAVRSKITPTESPPVERFTPSQLAEARQRRLEAVEARQEATTSGPDPIERFTPAQLAEARQRRLDAIEARSNGANGVGVPPVTAPRGASAVDRVAPTGAPTAARSVTPAAPVRGAPAVDRTRGLALDAYPRPERDNGRGVHWIPTLHQDTATVDRFVHEAKEMNISWVVFLNDHAKIGENDYLVKKLVESGIEPIMRLYTPNIEPINGDVEAMVRHYQKVGVDYFQVYNEPNLRDENGGQAPDVDRYLDAWIPVARQIARAGGHPGFGALAPGGHHDDMDFLRQALDGLKARGALDTLDRGWISLHNYFLNHPIDYTKDSNGFLKFRWYDKEVKRVLGRSIPVIGTEGGTQVGESQDKTMASVDVKRQVDRIVDSFKYMANNKEPYFFANTLWILANEAGGGQDPRFRDHALIRPEGPTAVVDALKKLR